MSESATQTLVPGATAAAAAAPAPGAETPAIGPTAAELSATPESSDTAAAALSLESSDALGALKEPGGGRPPGSPFKPRSGPTLTRSHTLASSGADDKRDRPSALSRAFNPPKLERKHSSGDLHSRLKTRKILGVGETDNGDIHRSKISQVLGHNEHLYVRLPRGFWSAHVIMGVGVTIEAALLLLAPTWAAGLGLVPAADVTVPTRLAGAAIAGLCVFVWSLLGTSDKHYARTMLLSMLTFHILSICVSAPAALSNKEEVQAEAEAPDDGNQPVGEDGQGSEVDDMFESRAAMLIGARVAMCLICLAYFYSIVGYTPIRGIKPSGCRKSSHIQKEH